MNDMFDFNGDGKIDTGEQFVGYQLFQDMTDGNQGEQQFHAARSGKLDGFEIFILILLAYQVLSFIADLIY